MLNLHTQGRKVRHYGLEEVDCLAFAFLGMHLNKACRRVVIDGLLGKHPTSALSRLSGVKRDPAAWTRDTAKFLGAHLQQLSRGALLVAQHLLARLQHQQTGQTQTGQQTADDGHAAPHQDSDASHRDVGAAQLFDALGRFFIDGATSLYRARAVL